ELRETPDPPASDAPDSRVRQETPDPLDAPELREKPDPPDPPDPPASDAPDSRVQQETPDPPELRETPDAPESTEQTDSGEQPDPPDATEQTDSREQPDPPDSTDATEQPEQPEQPDPPVRLPVVLCKAQRVRVAGLPPASRPSSFPVGAVRPCAATLAVPLCRNCWLGRQAVPSISVASHPMMYLTSGPFGLEAPHYVQQDLIHYACADDIYRRL
ncbi:MAG: hypothetical protein ACJATT_004112, partial [Myxococcota bacterium]